jgi:hypothetical protein
MRQGGGEMALEIFLGGHRRGEGPPGWAAGQRSFASEGGTDRALRKIGMGPSPTPSVGHCL